MSCSDSSSPPVVFSAPVIGASCGSADSGPPMSVSAPNSGSTKLTDGRPPVLQSARNCSTDARLLGYFSTIERDDRRLRQVGEVVAPADAVGLQAVEDRAVGRRRVCEAFVVGGDVAVGGGGHQEAPVGVGLARRRAEPAVVERERAREGVGERQHVLGPVAHRLVVADRSDEAVHLAAVDLLVCGVPGLRHDGACAVVGSGKECTRLCRRRRVAVARVAGGVEAQAVRLGLTRERERAEQVVEGVVLHHHDDNVVERQRFGRRSGRAVRVGQAVGRAQHGGAGVGSAQQPPDAGRAGQRGSGGAAIAQRGATRKAPVGEEAPGISHAHAEKDF